jgi:hypothetical protein
MFCCSCLACMLLIRPEKKKVITIHLNDIMPHAINERLDGKSDAIDSIYLVHCLLTLTRLRLLRLR